MCVILQEDNAYRLDASKRHQHHYLQLNLKHPAENTKGSYFIVQFANIVLIDRTV